MPKTFTTTIIQSEKDAEYLRTLASTSKLAGKCTYVGTYSGRFLLCYEKHCGKFIYYAVDMLTGHFSHIHENSFAFSESMLARELGRFLANSVKYTGCFNRVVGGGKTQKTLWTTQYRA